MMVVGVVWMIIGDAAMRAHENGIGIGAISIDIFDIVGDCAA